MGNLTGILRKPAAMAALCIALVVFVLFHFFRQKANDTTVIEVADKATVAPTLKDQIVPTRKSRSRDASPTLEQRSHNQKAVSDIIGRIQQKLKDAERKKVRNLGVFELAGRSTMFLALDKVTSLGDLGIDLQSDIGGGEFVSEPDREYIKQEAERFFRQSFPDKDDTRLFVITGPGSNGEPGEIACMQIPDKSFLGTSEAGLPTFRGGLEWSGKIDDRLLDRYGHLFSFE